MTGSLFNADLTRNPVPPMQWGKYTLLFFSQEHRFYTLSFCFLFSFSFLIWPLDRIIYGSMTFTATDMVLDLSQARLASSLSECHCCHQGRPWQRQAHAHFVSFAAMGTQKLKAGEEYQLTQVT